MIGQKRIIRRDLRALCASMSMPNCEVGNLVIANSFTKSFNANEQHLSFRKAHSPLLDRRYVQQLGTWAKPTRYALYYVPNTSKKTYNWRKYLCFTNRKMPFIIASGLFWALSSPNQPFTAHLRQIKFRRSKRTNSSSCTSPADKGEASL